MLGPKVLMGTGIAGKVGMRGSSRSSKILALLGLVTINSKDM